TVEAQGFDRTVIDNIQIAVGAKVTRNINLNVGTVMEQVTVDGSGINVNTVDASVSAVIDRQFVANIPLSGRSFQSLMTIVPVSPLSRHRARGQAERSASTGSGRKRTTSPSME
ncbi:MAG: hypothetical protein KJZ78_22005, partial [Bryobacteraceae bacterium]|nr:hypothetical protein [Bryobacteraceae bacterium]